ncbi:flavin reductase family protein [Streptomyces djakartensis]|uniref:Oxidoreductase n=1 Tax=Streptomyces djakartensis TaxID=68193 RepID=A0ABQ2Z1D9_9ACTN|nr:flavin reductase family protein [Streptomyces djakartensis]GGY01238.1 oxidoreductase [Streptomyces djakartensis]
MRQVTTGAPLGDRDDSDPFTTPQAGEEACLDFYARLASGVTVVTVQGPDGPAGSTVSAVTSLSADPPLLLVCMGTGSRTLSVIETRGRFAVNLLPQSQRARAKLFADPRVGSAERFAGVDHRRVLAVPVLEDTLGWSVCLTEDIRRYGDHCLVVGRIAAVRTAAGRPLLWHGRSFHTLADEGVPLSVAPDHRPPLEEA